MSGVLDDIGAIRRFDASDMLGAVAAIPAQIREAWGTTRELPPLSARHAEATSISLLGMGGSAIGGDLVRGIFSDRLTLPLQTLRDYDLPANVTASTLVVASSYSGATEETVSALAQALERRAPVVVITTAGPIREVASRAKLPLLTFPGGGQPRAAVGHSVILLAGLLERHGSLQLSEPEVEGAARAASSMLAACGADVPSEHNRAKQLAWAIVDRIPVIEASGFLSPVARRWKTQLNENGKSMAVTEELPEASHNAVVGYAQPEAVRDHLFVVFLSSPDDHPRNSLRASLSAELLATEQIAHEVVSVGGESRLAQAFSAIVLGDLVSVYLSFLYGLDPTPVEAIGRIKSRLSAAEEDSDD